MVTALLAMAAWAAEPDLLDVAGVEAQAGDEETARALVEWAARPGSGVEAEAARILEESTRGVDWRSASRLVGWQAVAGAWLLGPNVALNTSRYVHPNLTLGGMVLGAALGGGSAVWYADRTDLTFAGGSAIIAAQQLGMWNGVGAAVLADDTRFGWYSGLTAGALAGTGAGYLLATRDLDGGRMGAFHSGGFWGLGLGAMGLATVEYEGENALPILVVTTDLGAAALYGVAAAARFDRADVRLFNAGGALGAAGTGLLIGMTASAVEWDEKTAWPVVSLGSVAGGIVAVSAFRGVFHDPPGGGMAAAALVTGEPGDLAIGLPVPVVAPGVGTEPPSARVGVVEVRF